MRPMRSKKYYIIIIIVWYRYTNHHQNIGVAITQGNLCPRFCRYKSDFRTQNYKSGVSQEKNNYKRMSQLEQMFLQKSEGFTA